MTTVHPTAMEYDTGGFSEEAAVDESFAVYLHDAQLSVTLCDVPGLDAPFLPEEAATYGDEFFQQVSILDIPEEIMDNSSVCGEAANAVTYEIEAVVENNVSVEDSLALGESVAAEDPLVTEASDGDAATSQDKSLEEKLLLLAQFCLETENELAAELELAQNASQTGPAVAAAKSHKTGTFDLAPQAPQQAPEPECHSPMDLLQLLANPPSSPEPCFVDGGLLLQIEENPPLALGANPPAEQLAYPEISSLYDSGGYDFSTLLDESAASAACFATLPQSFCYPTAQTQFQVSAHPCCSQNCHSHFEAACSSQSSYCNPSSSTYRGILTDLATPPLQSKSFCGSLGDPSLFDLCPKESLSSSSSHEKTSPQTPKTQSFEELCRLCGTDAKTLGIDLRKAAQASGETLAKSYVPGPPHSMTSYRVLKRQHPKKPRREKRLFDYAGVYVPQYKVRSPELTNWAKRPNLNPTRHMSKLLQPLDQQVCVINRTRYVRGSLECLDNLHPNVVYEKNPYFDPSHPYQQEFTRIELDPATGDPIMETRSGLCAYCEDIGFFELKNSCYSQHMSHSHGVYTDNYLTPNPVLHGQYQVTKKASPGRRTKPRTRNHEGVVCPACYEIVEIRCWSSTLEKKPLSNYLRHFKEAHRVDKRKESYFDQIAMPRPAITPGFAKSKV